MFTKFFMVTETHPIGLSQTHQRNRFNYKVDADARAEEMAKENPGKFYGTFEVLSMAHKALPTIDVKDVA